MRNNSGNKQSVYSTVTREIYKTDGLRGFYRGFWPHFWRDVPTFGIYFLSYDIYQKIFLRGEDPKKAMEEKTCKVFMIKLLAGGFAGMTNWAFAYPQDVVKSFAQQASINIDECRRPSMVQIVKHLYKQHGI
jgi:hypothetical protein